MTEVKSHVVLKKVDTILVCQSEAKLDSVMHELSQDSIEADKDLS